MIPPPIIKALLFIWMAACAQFYNLDPERFQALAIVESRPAGGPELAIRVGEMGDTGLWGPFGINEKCFSKKAAVKYKNPYWNILTAAKTMRRLINKYGSWKAALHKYNANCNIAYIKEIERIKRKLERSNEE